jgi:GNAT superfamily N-acetyltransferase
MDRSSSAIPASLVLAREPYAGEGPQWVVAQAELGLTAAMFDPPAGVFLVARRGDAAGPPCGGAGVRAIHPGVGQIRRLWVDPALRNQCIARALMAGVEEAARELGLTDLRLGTGDSQPEAVSLYESSGWERVLVGNDGRPVPARHIWFVKRLTS